MMVRIMWYDFLNYSPIWIFRILITQSCFKSWKHTRILYTVCGAIISNTKAFIFPLNLDDKDLIQVFIFLLNFPKTQEMKAFKASSQCFLPSLLSLSPCRHLYLLVMTVLRNKVIFSKKRKKEKKSNWKTDILVFPKE